MIGSEPATSGKSPLLRESAGSRDLSPAARACIDRGVSAEARDDHEAARLFAESVALDPTHPEPAARLATVHCRHGNGPAVLALLGRHYDELVGSGLMLDMFVHALHMTGQPDKAIEELAQHANRRALSPQQWLMYLALAMELADWRLWRELGSRVIEACVSQPASGQLPLALYLPFDAQSLQKLAQYEAVAVQARVGSPFSPVAICPDSSRPIRIGYVCGDVREHPSMHLAGRMFGRHDSGRFQVHFYDVGGVSPNPWREYVRANVSVYRPMFGKAAAVIARQILADHIDILVDTGGHLHTGRPDVFALRPAPIQAHWYAMPCTTGASWMDYFIGDDFAIDERLRPYFSESIARLPHCYLPTDREQPIATDPVDRAAAGLPENVLVFCSFNQPQKLTPEIFACWLRILRAVPDSVLWLMDGSPARTRNLSHYARIQHVDPARMIYAQRLDKPEHLARLRLADLCLDTQPYGGHTTTIDALWAGRPVLTIAGNTLASRAAGSVLRAMAMDELVCDDLMQYEATAVALAQNPSRIKALHLRIETTRMTSKLFNSEKYIRDLEELYEAMFSRLYNGEPPADIGPL